MFTGIVSDVGTIRSIERRGDARVVIACAYVAADIAVGASIACSGVCLTVVDRGTGDGASWFAVDVSAETLSRTASGQWVEGRRLNLERAVRVGDELGGHIVSGHVDGIATVADIAGDGGSHRVGIMVGRDLAPYVAEKGSVTVDGVSLTVNSVADGPAGTRIGLNIIPHSWAVTTLGGLRVGDEVNVEIDLLARYLARLEAARAAGR